jgi:peptidoglycan/xylan/chitin deacetylase (PgdA/CDA1 family)
MIDQRGGIASARRLRAVAVLLFFNILFCVRANADCPPDALGTSRILPVGTIGGGAIGLKTYPQTLNLEKYEVVLTFDDGPLPATTNAILQALAKECVKATFFLIGRNALAAPGLVKQEIEQGHSVGHHTMTHPSLTLRNLSDQRARDEIQSGMEADDRAGYGIAESEPKVPFFRFPGFADSKPLVEWLASRNIVVFGADLWASDWVPMDASAELDLLLHRLEQAKKGIILLHDSKRQTAEMIPALLRELKSRGYHIVHIVPAPGRLESVAAPANWSSETERTLAHIGPRALPIEIQHN